MGMRMGLVNSTQLTRLSDMMRETGDTGIRNRLRGRVLRDTQTARIGVQKDIHSILPKSGGAADEYAAKPTVRISLTQRREHILFTMSSHGGHHDYWRLNQGILNHPLFARGDKDALGYAKWTGWRHWYQTRIASGWWQQFMTVHGERIVQGMGSAVADELSHISV